MRTNGNPDLVRADVLLVLLARDAEGQVHPRLDRGRLVVLDRYRRLLFERPLRQHLLSPPGWLRPDCPLLDVFRLFRCRWQLCDLLLHQYLGHRSGGGRTGNFLHINLKCLVLVINSVWEMY